jgi:hypothetical protein
LLEVGLEDGDGVIKVIKHILIILVGGEVGFYLLFKL